MTVRLKRPYWIVLAAGTLLLATLACSRPRQSESQPPTTAPSPTPDAIPTHPATAAPASALNPTDTLPEPTGAPTAEPVIPTPTVEAAPSMDPTSSAALDDLDALLNELDQLNSQADGLDDLDDELNP